MSLTLVENEAALQRLCAQVTGCPWIALDTEFTRERTFYARLGLLQIATDDVVACIDPLVVDLAPLLDVLYDERVLKVLHAGRQDLEVFFDLRGTVPQPVFDTQIAAALLGYADQVGYATLVESITGVRLPKLHTRTNWEARPLAPEQLRYAEEDVTHLREVYHALAARLEARGRSQWLVEECEILADPALYRSDPDTAYLRLSAGAALPPAAQPLLKALAAWRERTAQTRNRPRAWIAPDAALLEIARAAPASLEALARVAQVTPKTLQNYGEEILRVVLSLRDAPAARVWAAPVAPSPAEQDLARRMLARIKTVAEANEINPGVIATRRAVFALIGSRSGPLTRGWRRELVGEELLGWLNEETVQERRAGRNT